MEIRTTDMDRILNSIDDLNLNTIYEVDLNCIYDAGLNPREIDIKYAEEISLNIPPIIIGIIKNSDIKKFAIIDGNHRFYNRSKVEKTETIQAFIRVYNTQTEAFIDAYKANLEHGRRLTDREELKGIQRIINCLKEENPDVTSVEIAKLLDMKFQRVSEYFCWIDVNKVLGKEIVKWKAQKLAFMIKSDESGETLRKFWNLNSNLSKPDFLSAIKHFKNNDKEVVDFKKLKISSILENDDFDDGLRIKKEEKINRLSDKIEIDTEQNIKTEEKVLQEADKEIIKKEVEHFEEENRFNNLKDFPEENNLEDFGLINNTKELEEITEDGYDEEENHGTSIPVSKNKDLVALDGYSRFYKFETVAKRYLSNITEEMLTNIKEFKSLVNNNINEENKESYNKLKSEFKGSINNMQLLLKDLMEFISK